MQRSIEKNRRRDVLLSLGGLSALMFLRCRESSDDAATLADGGDPDASPRDDNASLQADASDEFILPADSGVCTLNAEQEEGPFYVSLGMVRSDIREDQPGAPLDLAIVVVDASTCKPIKYAAVDIWCANALGVYSGETPKEPRNKLFCAVFRSPTTAASRSSRPSTPAGTAGALTTCT